MATYSEMTAQELARRLGSKDEPFLLDVREPSEVSEWAIPEARNIPLGQLSSHLDEIPRDREIATLCAAGARSSQAAWFLAEAGYKVSNVIGGMEAWGQVYDTAVLSDAELRLIQVRRRGKGCLSYVVGGEGTAFVIDPSLDIDVYLEIAGNYGWKIERVFDTHLHADHLSGARELARTASATLHLNPADTFDFDYSPLSDGDVFELPGGHNFKVGTWHTPGHTNGSTVFEVSELALISGDTIFADGVGRPDLADKVREFASNLHESLNRVANLLPENVMVLPAHYSDNIKVLPDEPVGNTIGNLKMNLEPFSMTKEEFISWAEEKTTPRPPNYIEIIKANMGRPSGDIDSIRLLEAGPNRCSAA